MSGIPLEPTRFCVDAWRRFGQGRPKAARVAGRLEGSAGTRHDRRVGRGVLVGEREDDARLVRRALSRS